MFDITKVLNAVKDMPDERDYKYDELVGAIEGIKYGEIEFPIINIFNQGVDSDTHMACSRMGIGHIIRGIDKIQNNKEEFDIKAFWLRAVEKDPSIKIAGDYLQNALKQAVDEGLIDSYYIINKIEGIEYALSHGHFVYTGSNTGYWRKVQDEGVYDTVPKAPGHAWDIVGTNKSKDIIGQLKNYHPDVEIGENDFIGLNSYGMSDGYFKLPKELFSTLFTTYAIIPKQEYDFKTLYKTHIIKQIGNPVAATAFKLGLWNGERGDEPVTRTESSIMSLRSMQKLAKMLGEKTGEDIAQYIEDSINENQNILDNQK